MTTEMLLLPFLFVFGACIGSFVNAFNWRYTENKSLLGRSQCPKCGHKLSAWELVPLVSYLLQKGRCLACKKKISPRYPLVELIFALSFVFAGLWLLPRLNPDFLLPVNVGFAIYTFFIVSVFLALAASDLSWGIIPDRIVLPAIAFTFIYKSLDIAYRATTTYFTLKNDTGLGHYLLESGYFGNLVKDDLLGLAAALLLGAGIAGFFLLLIFLTRGRAMGLGDVKLGFLLGLALGFPAALVGLALAFLTGALASVMLILASKKGLKETIPFGPFLALGGLVGLFYGDQLLNLYLSLMK